MNPINTPPISWDTTGTFTLGLLVVVMIVGGLLWAWNQGRKAFGRVPPLNDELERRQRNMTEAMEKNTKDIRRQIYAVEKNLHEAHAENTRRIELLETNYAEMQTDRIRKWGELKDELGEVKEAVSFIRGRFTQDGKL